jgi:predicted SAM-dependent methyltransferase
VRREPYVVTLIQEEFRMNIREALKQSDSLKEVIYCWRKIRRNVGRNIQRYASRKVITRYMASNGLKKLHIGAGPVVLEDWLCTDIDPRSPQIVFLDATKPFPFKDQSFDYIYCEHMIEHISWDEGLFMLKECRRVLKPQGKIRITTPDLEVFMKMYANSSELLNERYIKWSTDNMLMWRDLHVYQPAFVVNNMFRDFGHQFIYDDPVLVMALERAGFSQVTRCRWGESTDKNLQGLESHGKSLGSEEMARYETMIFEAVCA